MHHRAMRKTILLSLVCTVALAAFGVGRAQDGVSIATDNMAFAVPDYGSVALTQSILESTIEPSADGPDKPPRSTAANAKKTATRSDWRVDYDSALSRRIEQEYLRNISERIGPQGAEAIAAHLEQEPVAAQFDSLAAPYGLSRSNLSDVIATYLAVAWATANLAPAPTREQVLGLRRQIRLASDRAAPRSMAERQKVAESIMYRVTQLAMQKRIADRRGDQARRLVADSVQRSVLKQQGVDLRSTGLTAAGFVRR
jgi:hypothetical protein